MTYPPEGQSSEYLGFRPWGLPVGRVHRERRSLPNQRPRPIPRTDPSPLLFLLTVGFLDGCRGRGPGLCRSDVDAHGAPTPVGERLCLDALPRGEVRTRILGRYGRRCPQMSARVPVAFASTLDRRSTGRMTAQMWSVGRRPNRSDASSRSTADILAKAGGRRITPWDKAVRYRPFWNRGAERGRHAPSSRIIRPPLPNWHFCRTKGSPAVREGSFSDAECHSGPDRPTLV